MYIKGYSEYVKKEQKEKVGLKYMHRPNIYNMFFNQPRFLYILSNFKYFK